MMHHLVVGAGPIGRTVALRLIERGDRVSLATRSGTALEGAHAVPMNASDAAAFSAAAAECRTIFLCTSPTYHRWAAEWPPIFAAAIEAARRSGAGLVIMGNLYAYGQPEDAMVEATPYHPVEKKGEVRLACWQTALAAHQRGEIRAVEVRASDYFGPGIEKNAHLGADFFRPILQSKTARVIGDPDAIHSWSFIADIVSTLVAAADYTGAWGRAWHVPSNPPLSRNEIAAQLNARYGCAGRVVGVPQWLLRGLSYFSPMLREVVASSYQFRAPFVIDACETQALLHIRATPWNQALAVTAESYRAT
ncbi:MAG: NAD-dependent epimerase/dehydratase family protein [Rhodanobacter sp.]|jgi:nucleoside-diphosphate-sugar epimerase|nr:NAD-dependent epimerase/dehydratase family protein [Rhodanobacter sp.]